MAVHPSVAVARAAERLGSRAEARLLVAHVLGAEPTRLLLADDPTPAELAVLDALVERRLAGTPLQHLTGLAHFRTVSVEVGPGVFIPRPETEVMTGWALERLAGLEEGGTRRPVVVELCAGSGAISLALATEGPTADLHCVEVSPEAFAYLGRNLAGAGVDARLGDMADAFAEIGRASCRERVCSTV